MLVRCLPWLGFACLGSLVRAQSLNVDVGTQNTEPSASYPGPASSPGLWNQALSLDVFDLRDVHGVVTNADLYIGLGCPAGFDCDHPGIAGDVARLVEDGHRCNSGGSSAFLDQVANGTYVVTTIVFDACGLAPQQVVSVTGSVEGSQVLPATWSGALVLGENVARHTVTVTNGTITINASPVGGMGEGIINGFQIVLAGETPPAGLPLCYGDAGAPCPCANAGGSGRGCQNSSSTGGALLYTTGAVQPDTVVLNTRGELASALTIFFQGDARVGPLAFGDGLRCAGGSIKRLYVKTASSGAASAPAGGDPSITARSAALGDPIAAGERRYYQAYYRDPSTGFCPAPSGNTFNASPTLKIVW